MPKVRRAVGAGLVAGLVAGLTAVLGGCAATASGSARGVSVRSPEPTTPQVPASASDLARVCADGLGFPDLPAYDRAPGGVRPAVLMDKREDTWSQNAPPEGDYPRGWILGYTDDVAKTRLVICYERTGATPAGRTCAMKDRKTGEPFTLTMYDTTYRLRVLEARTGATLYTRTGRASSTRCPMFTYTSPGGDPTKHYTEARPADYRRYVKRFIAP